MVRSLDRPFGQVNTHSHYSTASIGYSLQSDNAQVCQDLLDDSWKKFEDQGIDAMITTIASQYESSPSGPYVFCYKNIQQGQQNSLDMVRFVHPYLELDEAVRTTVQAFDAADAAQYEDSYQNASLKAVQDCCGKVFNFTLNYNQAKSEVSDGQAVSGAVRNYLGFGAKYNGGTYFLCGCPTSDIPSGDRNNSNAPVILNVASSAFMYAVPRKIALASILLLAYMMPDFLTIILERV